MSIASGSASTAIGYQSYATGTRSFAFGESCFSLEQGYSFGQAAKANASQSIAIGRFVETSTSGSFALGISRSGYPMINNISNSLMIGFQSTQPTIFVGPAPSMNGIGNVGIGTSSPLQTLHVNGNVLLTGFNSTLLFADDPPINGGWGKWGIEYDASDRENSGLNFWQPFNLGKGSTSAESPKSVETGNYFLFLKDNGNVGIGTKAPLAKLHVEGSVCVSSLKSGSSSMIVADEKGILGIAPIPSGGDQMGSHIATQNIQMSGKFITNDDRTSTNEGIFVGPSGNVGIKTSNIADVDDFTVYAPDIKGAILRVKSENTRSSTVWTTSGTKQIGFGVQGNEIGYIYENDYNTKVITIKNKKVGIGLDDAYVANMKGQYSLFVQGGILAEEVKVQLKENWPDYVFGANYQLKPLADVEYFINNNQHLPDVPSQSEVEQDGINLGSMDAILLKKIEELTLYIIEQDKRIKMLEENQ